MLAKPMAMFLLFVIMALTIPFALQLLPWRLPHRLMSYGYVLGGAALLGIGALSGPRAPLRAAGVLGGIGCLVLAISFYRDPSPGVLWLTLAGFALIAVGGLKGRILTLPRLRQGEARPDSR